jgi:hypothetical protein
MKRISTAVVLLAAAAASASAAADPASLFRRVPAPPRTPAAAVRAVKVKGGDEPRLVAGSYDAALAAVDAQVKSAGLAQGQAEADQMGAGIDVARMQSDPAYAQKVQARMASMSLAEKMAMARRMQAAQMGAGRPLQARAAHGRLVSDLAGFERADQPVRAEVGGLLRKAGDAEDAAHEAVDRRADAALAKCPSDKFGFVLSCTEPLTRRFLAEHRAAEGKALAAENAAYARALKMSGPQVAAAERLAARAKSAGDSQAEAQASAAIAAFSRALGEFSRRAALRAAFWDEPGVFGAVQISTVRYFVSTVKGGTDTSRAVAWPPPEPKS